MAHDPNQHVRKTDVEAKQASHRHMNFRTLIISLVALIIIGAVLLTVFWQQTPEKFGAKSNGVETQPAATEPAPPATTTAPAPAAAPETTAPAPAAPEATDGTTDTQSGTESPVDGAPTEPDPATP